MILSKRRGNLFRGGLNGKNKWGGGAGSLLVR